jgi:hypothetical protein
MEENVLGPGLQLDKGQIGWEKERKETLGPYSQNFYNKSFKFFVTLRRICEYIKHQK